MKKFLFVLLFSSLVSFAQEPSDEYKLSRTLNIDTDRYKLYKTDNMWTFLKLDTATGKVSQIQYSTDGNQIQSTLSDDDFSDTNEVELGRFELYPTDNMYNFLMLDQLNGAVYQMQWSQNPENRGLMHIYSNGIKDLESTTELKAYLENLVKEKDSINKLKSNIPPPPVIKDSIN